MDVRSEQGATLILVTILLPLLVLFGSFALDISNWFVHKRHLQVQADAAALAAGSLIQVPPACDAAAITAEARRYAGADSGSFNRQLGYAGRDLEHVDVESSSDVCDTGRLDVTVSDSNLPWFLKVGDLVGVDDARARAAATVQVEQLASSDHVLPLSVEDQKVTHVRAFLVDEDTNATLASQELSVAGSSGGLDTWSTADQPLRLANVTQANLGVRLAVGYGAGSACPSSADVTCYATNGDALFHIHGFERIDSPVTTGPPALQSAQLLTCPPSPSPSFTTTSCQLSVRALVDFNSKVDGDIATETANATTPDCTKIARIRARLGGVWTDLHCVRSQPGEPATFEGSFDVAGGIGQRKLRLAYVQYEGKDAAGDDCGDGQVPAGGGPRNPDPCWGAFDGTAARGVETSGELAAYALAGQVNRIYSGGPALTDDIASATVTFAGGADNGLPATAVTRCRPSETGCAEAFNVTVDLPGPLQVGDSRTFNVVSPGSRDHVLDCAPGGAQSIADQFAAGCTPRFAVSADDSCPRASEFGSGLADPWTCALGFTGDATTATDGLTRRVYFGGGALGGPGTVDCSANGDAYPDWQADPRDPRIVGVLLTGRPARTFGAPVMPVHDFAYFYVQGWGGDPCAQSAGGPDPDTPAGTIRGTFIKYVRPNDGGATGSGSSCGTTSIGGCIPVMTR